MNKLVVREMSKGDGNFGFELERIEDRRNSSRKESTVSSAGSATSTGSSSTSSAASEPPVIVIQCEREDQRDEWLKAINDQIR